MGRSPGEGKGYPRHIFAWRIPWTEEPGGLPSVGSQRIVQEAMPSTSVNSPAAQPPRNNAGRSAGALGSTVLPHPARSLCCSLPSPGTRGHGVVKISGREGDPSARHPRNLSLYGLRDVKRGTQHCRFCKSHNRRDNPRIFDDIQISSTRYHFPQHSKHYCDCQADHTAWQTFIS